MKLKIKKSQHKGLIGKPAFSVTPELILTDEERELIAHYKMQKQVLFSKKAISILGNPTDDLINVTVDGLLNGDSYKCKSLDEVITYKNSLIEACQNLKVFLDVARSFSGEESYDIDEMVAKLKR